MLISGDCAEAIGTFDEENFAVAYNDVDYCLRPTRPAFASYGHRLPASATMNRFQGIGQIGGAEKSDSEREKDNLRRLPGTQTFADRAINPAYSRDKSGPKILPGTKLHIRRCKVSAPVTGWKEPPCLQADRAAFIRDTAPRLRYSIQSAALPSCIS